MANIKLGDEVKDTISGFVGVAISRHSYLQGCDRIGIQPPVNEDGELPESHTFDEPSLVIVARQKAKAGNRTSGGPEKYMPADRR